MAASSISGGVTSPMSCFPQRNPAPGRRLDRSVMLAKQLSNLLTELSRHSDVTTDTPLDMDQRFESLRRSEEHTSELQSLMRISYAVFCLKKKQNTNN